MRPIKPNTRRRSLWRTVLLRPGGDCHRRRGDRGRPGGLKVIDPASWLFGERSADRSRGLGRHSPDRATDPSLHRGHPGLLDESRRRANGSWLGERRKRFPKGVITNLAKILGRVTAREKPAGYYFLESDFLPVGTRPGIAGGTPLGKRAYTFNASNLEVACIN